MNWWALETHVNEWPVIAEMLSQPKLWELSMFDQHIARRLMQRLAASGTPEELLHCAELLDVAPEKSKKRLMEGLNRAFQGQAIPALPDALSKALSEYQSQLGDSGLILGVRQGKETTIRHAIKALQASSTDLSIQLELAKTFGEVSLPIVVPTLVKLATGRSTAEPSLQRVAMQSLSQYNNDSIPTSLVGAFGSKISGEHDLRSTACRTLASRPEWAKILLAELNAWRLRRDQVPPDVVQQLRTYQDPAIVRAVEQAFGKAIDISKPEQAAEYQRYKTLLTASPGNAEAGKAHFTKRCANCHQLFGEGKKVGPPLDGYERGNLTFWLNGIVDPSLEIREGFQSYLVLTTDGRALNGMIAAQNPKTITLRDAENQLAIISRDDIDQLRALETSLMPADVLKDMKEDEIRDLFAYLSLGAN
jgi:putative heme-binding domain-containing protein